MNLALIRISYPIANSGRDVFLDSAIPLTSKTDFFRELMNQRARVHEMQSGFFFLIAIGVYGWPMKVSLLQIVLGEDFVVPHQPKEKGDFGPNARRPYSTPYGI